MKRPLELILFPLVALICLVLEICDVLNLFSFFSSRYALEAILSVVALVLVTQGILRQHLEKVSEQAQNLQEHLVEINRQVHRPYQERLLTEVYTYVNPDLHKILGHEFFSDMVTPLCMAMQEHMVPFDERTDFYAYYVSTLQNFPQEAFVSITSIKTFRFWEASDVQSITAQFIKNGGKFQQIFVVKHGQDLALPEVQQFVRQQQAIGIDIVAATTSVAIPLIELHSKNLIVGDTVDIVWDISMNDEGNVELSTLIADSSQIKDHRRRVKLARRRIIRFPICAK